MHKDKDYLIGSSEEISHETILQQNENDGLADLERRDIYPELSNWHSARANPLYHVIKVLSEDGSWNGLYRIESKSNKPLPPELNDQSFTDPITAIKAIQNYTNQRKLQ